MCCFIQIDLEKYTMGVEDKQLNLTGGLVFFLFDIRTQSFVDCDQYMQTFHAVCDDAREKENLFLIDYMMTDEITDQGLLIR